MFGWPHIHIPPGGFLILVDLNTKQEHLGTAEECVAKCLLGRVCGVVWPAAGMLQASWGYTHTHIHTPFV